MPGSPFSTRLSGALAACALVAGCASTTVALQPSPQASVCVASDPALVVWAPRRRLDQKEVSAREDAAAAGLNDFFAQSGVSPASNCGSCRS